MKNNKIEVLEYTLPNWTACYLINGDRDNLTDEEIKQIDSFVSKEKVSFVSVNDDTHFTWRNDLDSLGADCSTFIAHKL